MAKSNQGASVLVLMGPASLSPSVPWVQLSALRRTPLGGCTDGYGGRNTSAHLNEGPVLKGVDGFHCSFGLMNTIKSH